MFFVFVDMLYPYFMKKKKLKTKTHDCFESTQEITNQINGPYLDRLLKSQECEEFFGIPLHEKSTVNVIHTLTK